MNTTTAHTEADHTTSEPLPEQPLQPQQLCRPVDDRVLAGVGAGIARYLSIDVTIVRVVLAVLAIAGGFGVPLYIAEEFIQSRAARSH